MERYPRGRRGRFAKPLVGFSPARVRIPLSPPLTYSMIYKIGSSERHIVGIDIAVSNEVSIRFVPHISKARWSRG
jgi:hypothetical protein